MPPHYGIEIQNNTCTVNGYVSTPFFNKVCTLEHTHTPGHSMARPSMDPQRVYIKAVKADCVADQLVHRSEGVH